MKSGSNCRFPYRAILSAALSLLSLCAFVLLVASADRLRLTVVHHSGDYPENLLTVAWLVGASASAVEGCSDPACNLLLSVRFRVFRGLNRRF